MDGTLLEARASLKSFRPRDEEPSMGENSAADCRTGPARIQWTPTSGALVKGKGLRGQLVANSKESLKFLKQTKHAGLSKVAVWSVPQMWQCFSGYSLFP